MNGNDPCHEKLKAENQSFQKEIKQFEKNLSTTKEKLKESQESYFKLLQENNNLVERVNLINKELLNANIEKKHLIILCDQLKEELAKNQKCSQLVFENEEEHKNAQQDQS